MDVKQLEKLREKASEELNEYEAKLRKINNAKTMLEKECNVRRGLIFSLESLIDIEEKKN